MSMADHLKSVMRTAFKDVWTTDIGVEMLNEVKPICEDWLNDKEHAVTDEQKKIIGAAMRTFVALVFLTKAEQERSETTRN